MAYFSYKKDYDFENKSILFQKAFIQLLRPGFTNFRLKSNIVEFTTRTQKFKRLICPENLVLNAGLKVSNIQVLSGLDLV